MHKVAHSGVTVYAGINIALVKYWGKVDSQQNLPAVGSVSLTLSEPGTTTIVRFDPALDEDVFELDGVTSVDPRVSALLDGVRQAASSTRRASVQSVNTVPTAAGLASSASGFAALGLAAWRAAQLPVHGPGSGFDLSPNANFDPRLLDLVRRGSGSAPRSLLGGFARREAGTGALSAVRPDGEWDLRLVIGLTVAGPKPWSSRDGMDLSKETSPYFDAWVASHPADLDAACDAIGRRDLRALGEVMEHSTLKMHACMLATRPPLRYWASATLAALDVIDALRRDGILVYATMDAGPHVKALCAAVDADRVREALSPVCRQVLVCQAGPGAGE